LERKLSTIRFGSSIRTDLLTERIQLVEGLALREANIEAVVRVAAWLEASVNAYQTIGVELSFQLTSIGASCRSQSGNSSNFA
jgi:hypothetical protein